MVVATVPVATAAKRLLVNLSMRFFARSPAIASSPSASRVTPYKNSTRPASTPMTILKISIFPFVSPSDEALSALSLFPYSSPSAEAGFCCAASVPAGG